MSEQSTFRILFQITFCGMTIWAAGCQQETAAPANSSSPESVAKTSVQHNAPKPVWQKHHDAEKYVGRKACIVCHAEISQSYDTHPMSHSVYLAKDLPLVSENAVESFDPPGPCQYLISRDDQGLSQTEEFLDLSGEVVYRNSVPVHYAVGSGQRGWSFLTDRSGVLTQGVATWYSTRNIWDLSPGYVPEKHAGFHRQISDGCVTCHVGRTNNIPGQSNHFGSPAFTELSIGCERCHGPGKDHIDFRNGEVLPDGPDPITNPASLGFAEQLSVCYQCHLHGEDRVVRSGRSEFDFRPGERLSDVWATFVGGSGIRSDATTEAVSQVEQMHSSRCFIESDHRMTCTSCHDPHRLPAAENRIEFYRSRCLSCHEQTDSACSLERMERLEHVPSDSCIDCHMPSLSAVDVPHTAQTDHRVLRVRQPDGEQSPAGQISFMDLSLFPIPESEQRRARGLLLARKAERTNDPTTASSVILMLTPFVDDTCTDIPLLETLAACHEIIGDSNSARLLLTKALKLNPRNESVLRRLLLNSQRRNQPEEALRYVDRVLQLYFDDGMLQIQRAKILDQLSRTTEAYEAARKAVALRPHNVEIRADMVLLAKKMGLADVATAEQAIIDRMKISSEATSVQRDK